MTYIPDWTETYLKPPLKDPRVKDDIPESMEVSSEKEFREWYDSYDLKHHVTFSELRALFSALKLTGSVELPIE